MAKKVRVSQFEGGVGWDLRTMSWTSWIEKQRGQKHTY